MKTINFIKVDGPYTKIVDSFIGPILEHLPEAIATSDSIPNAINVTFFIEDYMYNKRGTMVFISHGIADKKYRDAKSSSKFDYIGVSGPVWIDKMVQQGVPKDKLFMNGYVKLDPIFQGKITRTLCDKKRILWAPTHNTCAGFSSYPHLEKFFKTIDRKKFEVIVSPHPANSNDNKPTLQGLVDADIVVADSGSTLYEAWILNKQVVFPSWLIKDKITKGTTFESFIFNHKLGFHADNESELKKMIEYGLNTPIATSVKSFIEGIFPTSLRGNSGAETAKLLRGIANV